MMQRGTGKSGVCGKHVKGLLVSAAALIATLLPGCCSATSGGTESALLPPGATGPGEIRAFTGAGGRRLRYRVVHAAAPVRHLVYFHGIESHGTWFLPAAEGLAAAGCTTYLLDRRGSGLNRGVAPGDTPSAGILLEDVRLFRDHLAENRFHLVGLSWGGKLATAVALDDPVGVRSLVLITPGLAAKVDLPVLSKIELLCGLAVLGRNRISIPIEPEMFTETPRYLDFIRSDSWRLHEVTGRFLFSSLALDRRIRRGISGLHPRALLVLAERDRIIDNGGVVSLLSGAPEGQVQIHRYAEAIHSVQFDQCEALVARMRSFYEKVEQRHEDYPD